jgi:hypothetical protein
MRFLVAFMTTITNVSSCVQMFFFTPTLAAQVCTDSAMRLGRIP